MAVQQIFIFINKSAIIRNLTLISIIVVDNHKLHRLSKVRKCLLSESTLLYRDKLLSNIHIVERHVSFPPSSYRQTTYSWWLEFGFQ
jgi:hypothetical protein